MNSYGVFVQCSSVLRRGERLFIFGKQKGATSEFPYRAASSLVMFASHPYGLGAVLEVYTHDQGTRRALKG